MLYSKIKYAKLLIALSCISFIFACNATQTVKEDSTQEGGNDAILLDSTNSGKLHFYRESATKGMLATPRFHIDGVKSIKLPNGSVSTMTVPAGTRVIEYRKDWWSNSWATEDIKFEIDVEPGSEIFIKYIYGKVKYRVPGTDGILLYATVNQQLVQMPSEEAVQEIESLNVVAPLIK